MKASERLCEAWRPRPEPSWDVSLRPSLES